MSKLLCIVLSGDSICGGSGSWFFQSLGATQRGDNSLVQINAIPTYFSGGNIIAKNCSVAGTRLNSNGFPDQVPLAPIWVDPIFARKSLIGGGGATRKYVFINSIGANDQAVGGLGSPAAYADAVAASCADRKTAGADKVVMQTLLPQASGILESNRLPYNALLTDASWRAAHGIDYVLDLASEATMGNPANCSNTEWFTDGLHPTTAGHALLAPIALDLWSTILAGM